MEVHTTTCENMKDFQDIVHPMKVSRHMCLFFENLTNFTSGWLQRAYDVSYLEKDNQIVAMWVSRKQFGHRASHGTYVERKYRRQGLASLLWSTCEETIEGASCTDSGYRFLSALSTARENVVFEDCRY